MLKDAENYFRNDIEKITYAIAFIFSSTDRGRRKFFREQCEHNLKEYKGVPLETNDG